MSGGGLVLSLLAAACAGAAGAAAIPGDDPRRRLRELLGGQRPAGGASRLAAGGRPDRRLTDSPLRGVQAPPRRVVVGQQPARLPPASALRRDAWMPLAAGEVRGQALRLAVSGLAGLACAVLLGGPIGWAAGALTAALCARVLARLEPRAARRRRARIVADLPVAIDLLAACLHGGGTWHESVEAVAAAVGGPLGEELARVAARVRLGGDPAEEWLDLAREPVMAPLGRAAARAAAGGVPVAAVLARLARDQRRKARNAASDRARVAGVRSVAPLGLCFLPAFVLLGVVPAIAGIASRYLGAVIQ